MPGANENPWANELKTRKKSVPRKRSVHTNGNKGNETITCIFSELESNFNDGINYGPNASQKRSK